MGLLNSSTAAARSKNIATEIRAGRPQKQAVAIAYSVQRRAAAKKATTRKGATR